MSHPITEHTIREQSAPAPAATTSAPAAIAATPAATAPATAPPRPPSSGEYHRLPRLAGHRSWWWRPVVALLVFGASYALVLILLMVPLVILGVLVPALAPSLELSDARNPMDMLLTLGMVALMIPATLIASLAAYGRVGLTHSIAGRIRWRLMGRAAIVIVPLYLLLNTAGTLLSEREALEVPAPSAAVVTAYALIVLLVPLQAAAEEYAFRALPMQALGTWLRSPLWGILIPVPLFTVLHGYHWVGQVDVAVFASAAGLLAWKTGGLELSILLHVANNWTLFIVAPLLPGVLEQGTVPVTALLASTLPTVLFTTGLWWWFSRREGLQMREPARARAGGTE